MVAALVLRVDCDRVGPKQLGWLRPNLHAMMGWLLLLLILPKSLEDLVWLHWSLRYSALWLRLSGSAAKWVLIWQPALLVIECFCSTLPHSRRVRRGRPRCQLWCADGLEGVMTELVSLLQLRQQQACLLLAGLALLEVLSCLRRLNSPNCFHASPPVHLAATARKPTARTSLLRRLR